MSNTLFIVCPFSFMENTLKRKFGSNIYFISCPGAIIPYKDDSFVELLKEAIIINRIKRVYFVNDTACTILNSVLSNKTLFGLNAEFLIQSLCNAVYDKSLKGRTLQYQQFRLAEINLQYQKEAFLTNGVFTDLVIDEQLEIKTLITNRQMRIFKECRLQSSVKNAYEL